MPGTVQNFAERKVPLPVLKARDPRRFSRWRVGILIGVHILIIAHVVQWLIMGRTVSPAVLSETMRTLERGEITTGVIAMVLVLAATLIFGRFLCGWGCHMGAMQDLCRWLLERAGIKPRVLRFRLLGYIPILLAAYMFVWPTFKRELLAPAAQAWWPDAAAWLGPTGDFPGLSNRLMTDNLWAGLPGVWVAVPFLLICGAATVYFLGARGFCRYGCPYGGLFSPAEQLSIIRVSVNAEACDRCGLCTTACTTGVRVMEETRAYGRVVDRNCVKTLDCIAACPTGALALRPARPVLLGGRTGEAPPKPLHDMTWPQELLLIGAFLGAFFITRGLYGLIPMLMSVGIALCAAALAWQCMRVLLRRDARFAGLQLRFKGRLRPGGAAVLLAGAATGAFLLHSATVRLIHWRAGLLDDRVVVSREAVFQGQDVPPAARDDAARALAWYRLGAAWSDGGLGISSTPGADLRAAWLHLVRREYAPAESAFRRAIGRAGEGDPPCVDLGRTILLRGEPDRAAAYLDGVLARNPGFRQVRELSAGLHALRGDVGRAEKVLREGLDRVPSDGRLRAMLASLLLQQERGAEALQELRRAASDLPRDAAVHHDLALVEVMSGEVERGQATMERTIALDPASEAVLARQMADVLSGMGLAAEAGRWAARAESALR